MTLRHAGDGSFRPSRDSPSAGIELVGTFHDEAVNDTNTARKVTIDPAGAEA
jgi:alpha-D-ribose 1-methylphosphonate 5-triphosphate synthase subunit PhnL